LHQEQKDVCLPSRHTQLPHQVRSGPTDACRAEPCTPEVRSGSWRKGDEGAVGVLGPTAYKQRDLRRDERDAKLLACPECGGDGTRPTNLLIARPAAKVTPGRGAVGGGLINGLFRGNWISFLPAP
jgi:hypothetical protein